MGKRVLITGGAGFIGSHLADELLRCGYQVRALDNLIDQVHGPGGHRPASLAPEVDLVEGDVRDSDAVRRALRGVDAVFHLAALVGVGQSMYQLERYTSVNTLGTAVLLEALIETPVERLVVASSMSLYGEGLYRDLDGNLTTAPERDVRALRSGRWELEDGLGRPLVPVPTPETKPPAFPSVYALTKHDQERMCLSIGRAYGFPTVALRFFNVFGTRQALCNPYSGVLALFAARYLNRKPPLINEDGLQRRDFVHVKDVARACRLALEVEEASGGVFNVGSGTSLSIREVAGRMAHALGLGGGKGKDRDRLRPQLTGTYRTGDVRHCFADITRARQVLGYEPQVSFDDGLVELAEWLSTRLEVDRPDAAGAEPAQRGLAV
ncbi:MAG TPA: NAD-dependent epimerase/dehydratase family protein [Myxococcales bacterium]|jgi:dTDP-L-rhamnose 4-epimerase|nr:NAD-dependent epimerase/dehydratase family protein [Myxococcales bacterium]